MKVSLICAVKNEERMINELLSSMVSQTRLPDEAIIVDGGSCDKTVSIIKDFIKAHLFIKLIERTTLNISSSRNVAIRIAQNKIIACVDTVRLSKNWLEEIIKPFNDDANDISCGFFLAQPRSVFEVALCACTVPLIREINPGTFLPYSRSIAFKKTAWQAVKGYPEWLDYCEDLVFDLALKKKGFKFVFSPNAVVYYRPRENLIQFFLQYYHYARGDGKANLWLYRHLIRYSAYLAGLILLLLGFSYPYLRLVLCIGFVLYVKRPYLRLSYALKNLSFYDKLKGASLVPFIRIAGDIAKMIGYPVGLYWRLRNYKN